MNTDTLTTYLTPEERRRERRRDQLEHLAYLAARQRTIWQRRFYRAADRIQMVVDAAHLARHRLQARVYRWWYLDETATTHAGLTAVFSYIAGAFTAATLSAILS